MTGWIKIHRDLANHWIAQDMEMLGRWLDLLMYASHTDNKVLIGGNLIEVKRGQMIASCDFLAKRWKCSKSTVSKFLEILASDKMVERKCERKYTLLTICNYEDYQQRDEPSANATSNDERTKCEQSANELKNVEECKEININNLNARTREERVSWERDREVGFGEYVKANQMIAIGRLYSLDRTQVIRYIEAFLDKCQIGGYGHKDIGHFGSHLSNFIEKEMAKPSAVPTQPQQKQSKNILEMYG